MSSPHNISPRGEGIDLSAPQTEPSHITVPGNSGIKVVRSITIQKPAAELYAFWRSFTNLSQIIAHPVTITEISRTQSHWVAGKPLSDEVVEWTASVINDHPGELIAWRSTEDATVPHAGSVRFHPPHSGTGTEVTVALEYAPPGGKLAGLIAKLSSEEPSRQVASALERFKALMENGKVSVT